jgi:hypothetical protein
VLGHVPGHAPEVGAANNGAVEEEIGSWGRGEPAGEDLQQRGLAGAAGADDAEELAGAGAAGDVPEHVPETSNAVVLLLLVVCSAPHLERVSSCGHGDVVVDAPGFDLATSSGGFRLLLLHCFLLVGFGIHSERASSHWSEGGWLASSLLGALVASTLKLSCATHMHDSVGL